MAVSREDKAEFVDAEVTRVRTSHRLHPGVDLLELVHTDQHRRFSRSVDQDRRPIVYHAACGKRFDFSGFVLVDIHGSPRGPQLSEWGVSLHDLCMALADERYPDKRPFPRLGPR